MKCKIIISERTYLSEYLRSMGTTGRLLGKFLTKKLYPKADWVVSNSLLTQIDLKENFHIKTNFRVINNPIPLQSIMRLSVAQTDPALFETFTFIHVGGLRPEKNHTVLINAFSKIKHLNCRLLLLGKGESEIKLRQQVKELDIENKVIFLGFDNNPFKYLSKAGCFVLSSDYEGFPNSVQEALSCNLPVISTDCKAGPREILAPESNVQLIITTDIEIAKYGILVPVNNSNLLAKAMDLVYHNKELFNSLKSSAFERAKDFDTSIIIKQFKQLLSES